MTQTDILRAELPPDLTLNRLVEHHGVWTTLRALAAVLWRRRARQRDAGMLPDHLRRDLGLPERGVAPPRLRGPLI